MVSPTWADPLGWHQDFSKEFPEECAFSISPRTDECHFSHGSEGSILIISHWLNAELLMKKANLQGASTNGLVQDIAGRQRTLIQRLAKGILFLSQGQGLRL